MLPLSGTPGRRTVVRIDDGGLVVVLLPGGQEDLILAHELLVERVGGVLGVRDHRESRASRRAAQRDAAVGTHRPPGPVSGPGCRDSR
mgnify:CR=1 FL=1